MKLFTRFVAVLALLAGGAQAQSQIQHDIILDPAQSAMAWTGTAVAPAIVPTPDSSFELSGSGEVGLLAITQFSFLYQIEGSDIAFSQDLVGNIPGGVNPNASIELRNVRLNITSDPFGVPQGSGLFSAALTAEFLDGELFVNPPFGPVSAFPLVGQTMSAASMVGSFGPSAGGVAINANLHMEYTFTAPGFTDILVFDGGFVGGPCPAPVVYCTAAPNSASAGGARIGSTGTPSFLSNDFVLTITDGPVFQTGIFFHGSTQTNVPFGNGFRCAGGSVVRLPVTTTGTNGAAFFPLDLTTAGIAPLDVRNFQYWYRDPAAGGTGFNLSDGLSVEFCP